MKIKKHFLILVALAVIVSTFSCDKDDAEEVSTYVSSASMTATINDTAWSAFTRVTKHYHSTNLFVIVGTDTDGKILSITIKGNQVGTYNSSTSIDSLSAQVGAIWKPNSNEYISNKGTVEITEIDTIGKKISGTFNFDVVNTSDFNDGFTITSGKFTNLGYTEESDTTSNVSSI